VNYLYEFLVEYGLPSNERTQKSLAEIIKFRNILKQVTQEELESIHGIGKVTASFFIRNTRA
jgi:hypothetical protein